MGKFRVIRRSNRTKEDNLYEDIAAILYDPKALFYDGYYLPDDLESIYNLMNMVDSCYNQAAGVRSIGFEITLDDVEIMEASHIFQQILQWIGQEYYVIGIVKEAPEGYMIQLLVHTTSYRTGRKFHDNNKVLVEMTKYLRHIAGQDLEISYGTFFTGTSEDVECYM